MRTRTSGHLLARPLVRVRIVFEWHGPPPDPNGRRPGGRQGRVARHGDRKLDAVQHGIRHVDATLLLSEGCRHHEYEQPYADEESPHSRQCHEWTRHEESFTS